MWTEKPLLKLLLKEPSSLSTVGTGYIVKWKTYLFGSKLNNTGPQYVCVAASHAEYSWQARILWIYGRLWRSRSSFRSSCNVLGVRLSPLGEIRFMILEAIKGLCGCWSRRYYFTSSHFELHELSQKRVCGNWESATWWRIAIVEYERAEVAKKWPWWPWPPHFFAWSRIAPEVAHESWFWISTWIPEADFLIIWNWRNHPERTYRDHSHIYIRRKCFGWRIDC